MSDTTDIVKSKTRASPSPQPSTQRPAPKAVVLDTKSNTQTIPQINEPVNTINLRQAPSQNSQNNNNETKLPNVIQRQNAEDDENLNQANQELYNQKVLEAERNLELANRVAYVQQILSRLEYEESEEIRSIAQSYALEIQSISQAHNQAQNALKNTKAPSRLMFDAILIYTLCLDGYELIVVVLKIIAYIATGGAAAVAGEPATILADLALDIPLFGYMFLINRQTKKYSRLYDEGQQLISLIDKQLQFRGQAVIERQSIDIERFRKSSSFSAAKDRFQSTASKINQARNAIGTVKSGGQNKSLAIAEKIINKLKAGPLKKFGQNSLRILADCLPFIEVYPFRTMAVRSLNKDYKEAHQELILNFIPEVNSAYNNYMTQIVPLIEEDIEITRAKSIAEEELVVSQAQS